MIYLNDLQLRRRRCGGGDKLIFLQLRSRTLTLLRAFADGVYVHSLPRGKERTKKTRPGVPPGNPLALPLCKEGWGEKHKGFSCIARRKAFTSGRRKKAKYFAEIGRVKQEQKVLQRCVA